MTKLVVIAAMRARRAAGVASAGLFAAVVTWCVGISPAYAKSETIASARVPAAAQGWLVAQTDPAAPVVAPPPGEPVPAAPPASVAEMPPPPPMPMDAPKSMMPIYVLWGVGAASLLAGATFGILAMSAKKDFDDMPNYDAADDVHKKAIYADIGIGAGLVLLLTGTAFYFLDDGRAGGQPAMASAPASKQVARVRLDPVVSTRSAGGALTFRF